MFKLLISLCILFCADFRYPQVATKYGSLNGKWMKSRNGRSFVGFEGIPFAKPPVGELRFKTAEPPDRWRTVREATSPGQECIQYNYFVFPPIIMGSEDCLYLSVYTPDILFSNLLPVLVYFHGGAFEYGQGQTGHGPEFLMSEKIVIVSVNYRLGPFGFLSFEDDELPGNLGLKDQLLALSWVKENIANFGGHPKKVTIMGESAGGASVNFHLVSPLSKGLFQKAISMSGTSYTPWSIIKPGVARERAIKASTDLGCLYNGTKQTLDCLRMKKATDIVNLRRQITNQYRDPLVYYGPVIDSMSDKPFLPDDPKNLTHSPVPWLIGISSGEGIFKIAVYSDLKADDWRSINANLNNIIRTSLLMDKPFVGNDMLAEDIKKFYFNDTDVSEDSFDNLSNLFTDGWFLNPTIRAVTKHKGPVYLYYFDYLGKFSYADILATRRLVNKACHTDEVIYLWNTTDLRPPLEGDDLILSRSLVKFWTNFIKFGSPSTKYSILNWKKITQNNEYLYISNKGYTMETKLLEQRTEFWRDVSSKYNI